MLIFRETNTFQHLQLWDPKQIMYSATYNATHSDSMENTVVYFQNSKSQKSGAWYMNLREDSLNHKLRCHPISSMLYRILKNSCSSYNSRTNCASYSPDWCKNLFWKHLPENTLNNIIPLHFLIRLAHEICLKDLDWQGDMVGV